MRLRKSLVRHLVAGFKRRIGVRSQGSDRRASLSQTATGAGWAELSRQLDETEIHHQLADLDLPLYLTTNFDNFMTLALEGRGRKVRREALAWRQISRGGDGDPYHDFDPPATPQEPVVFHLFGRDEDPHSMVVTEDDHLDCLARIASDHTHLLPTSLAEALARTSLLFLGYRLHDLDLKVILRGLLPVIDQKRWQRYHVAVQIDPGARDQESEDEVRRYFQHYFGVSRIDVYWGSARQFMAEFHARWLEFRDE